MDGFNDLLEEIKAQGGPLVWVTQKKQFLKNTKVLTKQTAEQLKQQVLQSSRLKHVIDQIYSKQSGAGATVSREDLEKEAKKILDEMAYQFDLKYVRLLGYAVLKVVSRIFKHVYYNSDLESNMQIIKTHPVVFVPLHRSYMDFLLVSIMCYHKNIQMPGVATGQDFLGLSFLSNLMRYSGAFFIRRSFGSDELYWAVFHEYVQEHLLSCERPLEFFIEGTRSRTSKSLPPKFGMIGSCIEAYIKLHRVEDIYFVPISVTYEKLLEEMLYSSELLGIPKPKESVSGLMKARTILKQNYGSIFINFARPVSLREMLYYIDGPMNAQNTISQHTLTPSFVFEINKQQHKSIELVSYTLLIEMLKNQIVQPISIIATCLLIPRGSKYEVNLQSLCAQVDKLRRILLNLGAKVFWPKMNDLIDCLYTNKELKAQAKKNFRDNEFTRSKLIILENLETHSNLFDLSISQNTDYSLCLNTAKAPSPNFKENMLFIRVKQLPVTSSMTKEESVANLFTNSSTYIAFCSYRNQLVSFLIRVSLFSYALLASSAKSVANGCQIDENELLQDFDLRRAMPMFKFLLRLFNREFIFKPENEERDFTDSLNYLLHTNILSRTASGTCELVRLNLRQFFFFVKMFEYILEDYAEVFAVCMDMGKPGLRSVHVSDEKQFTKDVQRTLFDKLMTSASNQSSYTNKNLFDMESLSLNMLNNSFLSLAQFNVLFRLVKRDYEINLVGLAVVHRNLRYVIDVARVKLTELNRCFKIENDGGENELDFEFDDADQIKEKRAFLSSKAAEFDLSSKL